MVIQGSGQVARESNKQKRGVLVLTCLRSPIARAFFCIGACLLLFARPVSILSQSSTREGLGAAITAFEHSNLVRAQKLVQDYLALHPGDAAAWNLKGMIADSQKDFEAGGKDFKKALQLAPSASVYTNLGNHYLLVQDPSLARQAFGKALQVDPHHFSARFNLLNLVLNEAPCRQGSRQPAEPLDGKSSAGMPGTTPPGPQRAESAPECAQQAMELLKGFSTEELRRPIVAALRVRGLLAAGQKRQAVQAAQNAMADSPRNLKLAYSLGLELAQGGEAAGAVPFLERAESLLPPDQPNAHLLLGLGQAKFLSGQPASADFLRVKQLEPGWWQPYYYLGLAAARNKQYLQAGSLLVKAQKLAPSQAPVAAALANVAAAQGFWFDAADEWQRYLRLKPDDLRAYRELAIVAGVAHRQELAVRSMQRYLKAYPRDAEAFYMLALMEQDSGHGQEAIQALETCVKLKPDYAPGWATLAKDQLNYGQIESAKESIRRALEANPRYAPAHVTLAEIQSREGHPDLALPLLKQAVKEDPRDAAAYFQLALAERRTGNHQAAEKAAATFERLHKQMTLNPSGRGLLAYLQKDVSLSPAGQQKHYLEFLKNAEKMRPDSPRILCRLGVAEIAEGQTQEGLALVKRALQPSLPYDDALATARAMHAHGQDQLALRFYQLASSQPEAKADARAALGEARMWLLLGHPHKALETLDSVPAAAHPAGEAADLAGLIYARLGMNRTAFASFSVAIRLDPKQESFYRDAAIFLGSHGQWDAALKVLDDAKQQSGNSTSLLLDEAVLLQLSGHRDQAQALLEKLAIHADDPTLNSQQRLAALLLAISYYTTNRKPEAARIFQQLTRADPKLALAWYYRALMASESGNTSQALQWLARCLAIEPKYARALYLHGKLLASEGKLVDARNNLEAAAAADPDWSAPHYQLVQVFRRMKKPDLAASEAKTVKQLDAKSHGAQSAELREYLDSLTLPSEQGYLH